MPNYWISKNSYRKQKYWNDKITKTILEAFHIRNKRPNINQINFETSANEFKRL